MKQYWWLAALIVSVLMWAALAQGGDLVPRPPDPQADHLQGVREGLCPGGRFLELRGYGLPGSDTHYVATYVDGDRIIAWMIDEPPIGTVFDVIVVAFPGGTYERMSFAEVEARFPTACDLPLLHGGDA